MKKNTRKNLFQKIMCIILLAIICSFILPNYIYADTLDLGFKITEEEGDRF